MLFRQFKASTFRQREIQSEALKLAEKIDRMERGNSLEFGRHYLFNMPMRDKIAQLSRAQRYLDLAVADQQSHENKVFIKNLILPLIFLLIVAAVLFVTLIPVFVQNNLLSQESVTFPALNFLIENWQHQNTYPDQFYIPIHSVPQSSINTVANLLPTGIIDSRSTPLDSNSNLPTSKMMAGPIASEMISQISNLEKTQSLSRFSLNQIVAAEATAIRVVGEVVTMKNSSIKQGDLIPLGETVRVGKQSYLKLRFSDYSELGISAETDFIVDSNRAGEPLSMQVLVGYVRAKVVHYFWNRKEKFLIKTPNAAIGVRGTDFYVNYSATEQATNIITFEGKVAIQKLKSNAESASAAMQNFNGLRDLLPGELSQVKNDSEGPSVAQKLNPAQVAFYDKNSKIDSPEEEKRIAKYLELPPAVLTENESNQVADQVPQYRRVRSIPELYLQNKSEFTDLVK